VHVIAGPCAVEERYVEHAVATANAGASVLRGCVLKPRTSPDSFQGIGNAGLALLDAAKHATGLPVLAEPLEIEDIATLTPHVDALMIGARSMHNTPLLRAAGRSGRPVVVKRGMSATYDEWLHAARYVEREGNDQVILCERGIRTFETATRNTLDISAIAVLRERTDLPIMIDPSHATGRAAWVGPVAMAAVAAGADALLIESHPEPHHSACDAAQAIPPAVLETIVTSAQALAALARSPAVDTLAECRTTIDTIDDAILQLVEHRAQIVRAVQQHKARDRRPVRDPERERAVVERLRGRAARLDTEGVQQLMAAVIDVCLDATAVNDRVPAPDRDRLLA
jgi:3-deoxy-7-phosphoheptulonate synthase